MLYRVHLAMSGIQIPNLIVVLDTDYIGTNVVVNSTTVYCAITTKTAAYMQCTFMKYHDNNIY